MDKILGIIRHVLTLGGGVIIAQGLAEESLVTEIIGGLIAAIGGVWSILSKKK